MADWRFPRSRWRRIFHGCAVVATLLAFVACGDDSDDGDAVEAADEAAASATTTTDRDDELVPPDLRDENPAGRYAFEYADGILSVEAPEAFRYVLLGDYIVFDDPADPGGRSDYYGFLRVDSLPVDGGTVSTAEAQAWVDGLSTIDVVSSRAEGSTHVVRLTAHEPTPLHPKFALLPGELYEMWFLEVEDSSPLLLIGKTVPDTPEALDVLTEVAPTVTFRVDAAAAPETAAEAACADRPWECGDEYLVPAGEVCLPAFGGITFTMSENRLVRQQLAGRWVTILSSEQGDTSEVSLLAPEETVLGEPLTSADDVIEVHDAVLDLKPIEDRTLFGRDVGGYEFETEAVEPATLVIGDTALTPSPFTQMWVVDTEDGPILVSPYGQTREDLDGAVEILDDLGSSLTFTDGCDATG